MELALPNPKTAAIAVCDKTLAQFEEILPEADQTQTDAILDWLGMFMEARRLRDLWAKTSKLLRMAEVRWGELHPPQQGKRTDLELKTLGNQADGYALDYHDANIPGRKTSDSASEVNIRPATMAQFRTMAENREIVEDVIDAAGDRIVTRSEVLREIEKAKPHVAQNSGNNEWYTPQEYIDAARAVMGGIDLDPASSATANKNIKAARFYSEIEDGLSPRRIWRGRVWMNPPYSADRIGEFCAKLVSHVDRADVQEAIVLVNNATETQWFCDLIGAASAVCFPSKRIRFWQPDGKLGAPLQGQAVIYIGGKKKSFAKHFSALGWIANVVRE